MSHATSATTDESTPVGVKRLATYGFLAALLISAVNGLVRVIALTAFEVPLVFPLEWGPVIALSAIGAIGATLVYGLIIRVSTRPNRTFTIVAVAVLLLSFVPTLNVYLSPPPELVGTPGSVYATLGVMHVTAAAVIVSVLTRVTRKPRPQEGILR